MKTELTRRAKILRWRYLRIVGHIRYGDQLNDSPILLGISFPKSGTHLLTQVLTAFARIGPAIDSGLPAILTFEGASGKPRSESAITQELQWLQPGDIAYGHLHATEQIVSYVNSGGFAPYFIYRDPRDVVVSHVHYVTEMAPNHVHHEYYKYELKDFSDRLSVSITGRPELDIPFPDIHQRFLPYLEWLLQPEVLSIKFEDFIDQRDSTIEKILEHAISNGFQSDIDSKQAVEILKSSINPQQSPTYRSGVPGKWRSTFTEKHKKLFKDVSGDLLIQMGYEDDNDW